MRTCPRSGCRELPHVALVFDYGSSVIWIDHIEDVRLPHVMEICHKHWQRFVAPNGWSLEDRRRADILPFVHRLAG